MSVKLIPDYQTDSTSSAEVVFSGSWTKNQTDDSSRNTIKYASTTTVGDYVTISPDVEFSDAFIHGYAAPDGGTIDVYVDGSLYSSVDCYLFVVSSKSMKNANLLHITGLPRGFHTIKVVNSAKRGPQAGGTKVGFSHIVMMNPDIPLTQKNKTLLWVGDSISEATNGFTSLQITKILTQNFPSSNLNMAYSVRPSAGSDMARYFENELIEKRASFVSVMLGTNDVNTSEPTESNLQKIIAVCNKYGVPVQVCTIPPRSGGVDSIVNGINNSIRFLAYRNNVPCIDFHKGIFNQTVDTSLFNADGIHPTTAGHSVMARYWFIESMNPSNPFRYMIS